MVAAGGGAGWGVVVVEHSAREAQRPDDRGGTLLHELYGPVMLDRASPLYLGAERATNNTAELSAVVEVRRRPLPALRVTCGGVGKGWRWLRRCGGVTERVGGALHGWVLLHRSRESAVSLMESQRLRRRC